MKKLQILILFLALTIIVPIQTMAGTRVGVSINLPPIIIGGPPDMVQVPDTDQVYVAPDVNVELFFWNGWWWRPFGGHWYRSHYYDRGWVYYNKVPPGFYHRVDHGWRGYYKDHKWHGRQWNYKRIPSNDLQGHGKQGKHGNQERYKHK